MLSAVMHALLSCDYYITYTESFIGTNIISAYPEALIEIQFTHLLTQVGFYRIIAILFHGE